MVVYFVTYVEVNCRHWH